MKNPNLNLLTGLFVSVIGITSVPAASNAQATVQDPGNVVGTGATAWSYLAVEGEDYASETDATPGVGFTRVNDSGAITSFLGKPILAKDTTASKKGALLVQNAAKHGDKVAYQVQFTKPGTYYLYMRFSMFESGVNEASYLNEDSFFVPPDFGKDPQTDWPLMDAGGQNGGYTEGCCDSAGYLFIPEKGGGGTRVGHTAGDEAGRAFWEGNFHWSDLWSSQFLNTETQGEPRVRRKYEVTASQVGKPLTWTVSNRESGMAVDLWLFSTNPDLMDQYTQEELDQILIKPAAKPQVTVQDPGNTVGTGAKAWSYLVLEGEDYNSKSNDTPGTGFARADNSGTVTNALGNPVLGRNTTASKQGALWTQTVFAQHVDKATYQVQFAKAGTYYLYMRFTMFENGGNPANYLNEDSFFVPPDFGKDPQTDWPLSDRGGYAEGCCDGGFLTIKEAGSPVNHSLGDEAGRAYWEGNFHWNELSSSQFLNPETQGEPRARFKYEVTASQVGKPLDFTVSYREGGVTIDLWLFSTNPNLMDEYTQDGLDQLLINPRPGLAASRAGSNALLSWPAGSTGFVLESSTTLSPANWTAVTTAPVVVGGQNTVTVDAASGSRFYRLRKP